MTNGENRDTVRRRNLATLLGHIHRAGHISRAALTTLTGLNRSTVGALVGDLVDRGLVKEGETVGRGTPGRPSPLVRPRRDGIVVVAVEIEVATLSLATAGLGGQLRDRIVVDRAPDRRTPEATVEDLAVLITEAVDREGPERVFGLGVGVAGMVRREDGFVHVAPNLDWRNVPLAEMLRARLAHPLPVHMGNDAELGAVAEHIRGAGVGVNNLIYVASEVGVGGGIIVDGRLLRGAAGYAGEIGHIRVNPDGAECRCGARGCLEAEAGQWALLRHLGRTGTPSEREAVDEILREASVGSTEALAALHTIGTWLGVGLADLVNIFNPNRIVLGGLIAHAYPYLAEAIRRELDEHAQRPSREMVTIASAMLGDESTLVGAVELAFEPLLADPTIITAATNLTGSGHS